MAIGASSLFANQEVAFEELSCQTCPTENHGRVVCDPIMKKILAPGVRKINHYNIKSGKPLYAHKTFLMTLGGQNYTHAADYLNGTITTIFGAYKNGCFYDQVGEQTVMVFSENDCSNYYRSVSSNWDVEMIDGEEYIVHHHKYFNVYTNADTQYVKGTSGVVQK